MELGIGNQYCGCGHPINDHSSVGCKKTCKCKGFAEAAGVEYGYDNPHPYWLRTGHSGVISTAIHPVVNGRKCKGVIRVKVRGSGNANQLFRAADLICSLLNSGRNVPQDFPKAVFAENIIKKWQEVN